MVAGPAARGSNRRKRLLAVALVALLSVFAACLDAAAPPPPAPPGPSDDAGDYSDDGALPEGPALVIGKPKAALRDFTVALLQQRLAVYGQTVRIPNHLFSKYRCQVVYLASPDWATSKVKVAFNNGLYSTCNGSESSKQGFYAYVDGYHVPNSLGPVSLSSKNVSWTAVVADPDAAVLGYSRGSAPSPAPPPASPVAKLRRMLLAFQLSNRESFQSAFDNVRGSALSMQEVLQRGARTVPGPEGVLAKPVLAGVMYEAGITTSTKYTRSPLAALGRPLTEDLLAADAMVLTDHAKVFRAAESDCLDLMRPAQRNDAARVTNDPESCFVTQSAVYVYNPCVPSSEDDPVATPEPSSEPAAQSDYSSRLSNLMANSLAAMPLNDSLGYVDVSIEYEPYQNCIRKGKDSLPDVAIKIQIWSAIAYGWLLLFLLVPSLWRLCFEFPFRLIRHAIRKARGKDDKLKPMRPGLHAQKNIHWKLPHALEVVLGPVLRFRKYVLYAVATVNSSDGQYRGLQVNIISVIALSIVMAVYAPGLNLPLNHLIPRVALQITRRNDALAALYWFMNIVLFSCYMGTVGYLSLLANFNRPTNQYYRVQITISAMFLALLDLMLILQLTSMLAQWEHLNPAWPYFPLVVFQLINLISANVLQVVIFLRRHDLRNRDLYDTYMAAHNAEKEERSSRQSRNTRGAAQQALLRSASRERSSSDVADEAGVNAGVGERSDARLTAGVPTSGAVNFRQHRRRAEQAQQRGDVGMTVLSSSGRAAPEPQAEAVRSSSLRRSGGRQRTAAHVQPAEPVLDDHSPAAAAPASASRPRRRLMGDGLTEAGPLGEAREHDGGAEDEAALFLTRGSGNRVPSGRPRAQPRRLMQPLGYDAVDSGPDSDASNADGRAYLDGGDVSLDSNAVELPSTRDDSLKRARSSTRRSLAAPPEAAAVAAPLTTTSASAEFRSSKSHRGKEPARLPDASKSARMSGRLAKLKQRIQHLGNLSDSEDSLRSGASGKDERTGVRKWWRKFYVSIRESPDFRYPAWLLAALLVSAYTVIFQYGRALHWSNKIATCLEDPNECLSNNMGRYVRFASKLLNRDGQTRLRDSLDSLLATQYTVQVDLLGALLPANTTANSTSTNTTANSTDGGQSMDPTALLDQFQADLTAGIGSSLKSINFTQIVMTNFNMSEVVGSAMADAYGNSSGLAENLTAFLSARLETAINSRMQQINLTRVVEAGIRSGRNASAASAQQQAVFQARAVAWLNSTLDSMYTAVGTASRFMSKALDVQAEIRDWRNGLTWRFRWTSVLGFTLGLFLSVSTLLKTAMAFRRRVREMRLIRIVRMFAERNERAGEARRVMLDVTKETVAERASKDANISLVVFFFGVLMSTAFIQLYVVGVLFSVGLAVVTHPWTYTWLLPRVWLYILAVIAVFCINKYVLIGYVGNAFLSNGDHIYRPAAWLAFLFILSIVNLVIGLLLAVYRIVLLLLTTVLALGKLEETIFSFFAFLDLPHQSFLAGLHVHEAMSKFSDPIYLPGPRGRANRRWRKLRDTIRKLDPEDLRLLATLGRPKEVQAAIDHVVVDMKAKGALGGATPRPSLDPLGKPPRAPASARSAGASSARHVGSDDELQRTSQAAAEAEAGGEDQSAWRRRQRTGTSRGRLHAGDEKGAGEEADERGSYRGVQRTSRRGRFYVRDEEEV